MRRNKPPALPGGRNGKGASPGTAAGSQRKDASPGTAGGYDPKDHVAEISKMVGLGSGAKREVEFS
jgi:hypothetical protein